MRPLHLEVAELHRSARSAQIEVSLRDEGRVVARGAGLLFRPDPEVASGWSQDEAPPLGPDDLDEVPLMPREFRESSPPGFHWSLRVRIAGSEPVAWITTPLDLVAGEPIRDFERMAAVADLTFGLGGRTRLRLGQGEAESAPPPLLINSDTSLHLERLPVGEWTAMRASTVRDNDGIGTAEAVLWDRHGRFARSLQSLIARPPPPHCSLVRCFRGRSYLLLLSRCFGVARKPRSDG